MNLTRTNWPKGWMPNNDAVNGDPEGLLRMDNLRIDKNGVIGLVDGWQRNGSTAFGYYSAFYSKIVFGTEYIWTSTGNPPNSIRRTKFDPMAGETNLVIAGGGTPSNIASFGDAFGYVLCCAGKLRVKDQVGQTIIPLGLLTPTQSSNGEGPTGTIVDGIDLFIPSPTKITVGTGDQANFKLDTTFFTGQINTATSFGLDTTHIGGTVAGDPGNDIISFDFLVHDKPTTVITRVVLDFILDGNPADQATYQNYYEFVYDAKVAPPTRDGQGGGTSRPAQPPSRPYAPFQSGINTVSRLSQTRNQAIRFGNDSTKDWTNVIGVRFVVVATQQATVNFGDIHIKGGLNGALNGIYNYIQVDVANTGAYLAKSPASALGHELNSGKRKTDFRVVNGSVTLHPVRNDIHTTEHWLFRKSVASLGIDPNTGQSLNPSSLNQFYFVGKTAVGTTMIDNLSDDEVLQLNADGSLVANLFLQTLNSNDHVNGLQADILAISDLTNERVVYMTTDSLYLSDRLNPDAVDTRYTIKPSGDPGEKNLWFKKLTNNVFVLATTKELYEISGTFLDLPDGSIDVTIRALGEAYPPMSRDACHYDNGLYYIAADGLRVTTGSNSVNVSPQLRQVFQNTVLQGSIHTAKVHGIPTVAIYNGLEVNYAIAAARGRIYMSLPMTDLTRRLVVFDTFTKTYSMMNTDPAKLYTTQAGELFASYSDGSSWFLDSIPGYGLDNNQGLPFRLRTVFDSNSQPRNRKDTFTLKLIMDTGGRDVSVQIQKDGIGVTETDETSWVNLGNYNTIGQHTIYIPLSQLNVTLGFRYALQISDVSGVFTFKLYEATIEYEPRPEQLAYLRIPPTNLGTISRKRWTSYAFIIDTLGNNVTFAPYLDNVVWGTTAAVNTGTKLTYIFYFRTEAVATDMAGIISGGVFEFYGVALEECVSEKLPTPCEFLVIPPNNYGTPNRKRHTSYKFQILTRGADVVFQPLLDGAAHTPATYNTTVKKTVDYYFPQSDGDVIGIDIGGTLTSQTTVPFEFYGVIVPQTVETLPDRLEYLRIPNSNFGTANRKRIRTISLVLDTRGQSVNFTPYVDNVPFSSSTNFQTFGKSTVWFYFNSDVVGVDFGGVLSTGTGHPFEFYGLGAPDNVESLPLPVTYYIIPPNNYGTPDRKRHTSYKFEIITRANRVRFFPVLDGVAYPYTDYVTSAAFDDTTAVKQTVEYFFPAGDVIGIDIGGRIESLSGTPFEFYGTIVPQKVETLPERLQYLRLPNTNFGVPSRKRIRTLPMVIDTYGHDVTFYPIVDDTIVGQTSTFNTKSRTTVYHYFVEDVFGTDFGGILSCDGTGKWLRDGQSLPFTPE